MVAQGAGSCRRTIGRAAYLGVVAAGGLASCGLGGGTVPLAFVGADQPGFKMLRPGAKARACGATVWSYGARAGDGLLQAALVGLLAQTAQADVIRDVHISWRGVDLVLAQVGCVSVRGDLGRVISTVKLPMLGDHGDHSHHGGVARHEEER
jgi:hypothetical protein